MKINRLIKLSFLIFIIQLFACRPKPHTGPHDLIVLELDTAGFYKQPGKNNPANIRFLAKKAATVIRQRLETMEIDEDNFELSDTNNLVTLKLWQPKISIKRIGEILQANGNFGFWRTYPVRKVYPLLFPYGDSTATDSVKLWRAELWDLLKLNPEDIKDNGFSNINAFFGHALPADTERINTILGKLNLQIPLDMHFKWGFMPGHQTGRLWLYILKGSAPVLANPILTEVQTRSGKKYNGLEIYFKMDEASAALWKRITKENLELDIALTMDGRVCTCPRVVNEIPNGVCTITGDFSKEEVDYLAAVLSSGSMPAPIRIVEEKIEN